MEEEFIVTSDGNGHPDIPAHPQGAYPATCIDIIDRGSRKEFNRFHNKEEMVAKLTLRFFCGQYYTMEDGTRLPLWVDKWFRASMHEKAALRKFVGQWRGKPLTEDEAKRYNIAKLLHQPALLQITHNVKPDRTYANIDSVMSLLPGMTAPVVPGDYVRVKDRPPRDDNGAAPQAQQTPLDRTFQQQARSQRAPASPPNFGNEPDPVDTRGDDDLDLPF